MTDVTDSGDDLANEVVQLLVAMSGRLSRHFAACAAEFGLSAGEGKVLLALEPGEPRPMRVIARKLGYDASNLTAVVDRLEDRGVLRRCPDPADRRVKALVATDSGLLLTRRLAERLRAGQGPVHALTVPQLRQLRGLLRRAMAGET
ncbi:MarR family winged helix-turn-helix transcriptional regulator [Amycolatopsis aidingensis]|uniref:MarR family winged helix-turn-helix transcriptional regulator n=1 Tax=Amycolatopsis aidingensis TaxID=2842453 RepID=UPI001C0D8AC9|nr:MarR family transcriptional regulator [Amycolatopsis aidingensis]